MIKYKADITVKLKNGVRDPQGSAIETVLKRVKGENTKIHVGKFFSIEIEASDIEDANEKISQISNEILSNPILEEYEMIRLEEV